MELKIFSMVVLLITFRLTRAATNNITIFNNEISWKRYSVSWNASNQTTNYGITLKCGNTTINNTTTALSFIYYTVPTNTSCSFEVQAVNNDSNESSIGMYYFQSAGSPEQPGNLTVSLDPDQPSQQLKLDWIHPKSLTSNRLKTVRYQITYADSLIFAAKKKTILTDYTATSFTLAGLKRHTIYWINVAAYDNMTRETGQDATVKILTDNTGVSNLIIALVTIGAAVVVIIILAMATNFHFKSKYRRI